LRASHQDQIVVDERAPHPCFRRLPRAADAIGAGKDREISPEKSAENVTLAIMPSHIQTLEM
jgi:hypothetical protein